VLCFIHVKQNTEIISKLFQNNSIPRVTTALNSFYQTTNGIKHSITSKCVNPALCGYLPQSICVPH